MFTALSKIPSNASEGRLRGPRPALARRPFLAEDSPWPVSWALAAVHQRAICLLHPRFLFCTNRTFLKE